MANIFAPGVFYAPAAADYSAESNIGKFVKLSSGNATLCTVAGEQSCGVLANNPGLGQPAEIHCGRVTKVRASGALSVMQAIKTDVNGRAAAASLGTGTPLTASNTMGQLYEAPTAIDQLVTAWVAPMGATPTTVA